MKVSNCCGAFMGEIIADMGSAQTVKNTAMPRKPRKMKRVDMMNR